MFFCAATILGALATVSAVALAPRQNASIPLLCSNGTYTIVPTLQQAPFAGWHLGRSSELGLAVLTPNITDVVAIDAPNSEVDFFAESTSCRPFILDFFDDGSLIFIPDALRASGQAEIATGWTVGPRGFLTSTTFGVDIFLVCFAQDQWVVAFLTNEPDLPSEIQALQEFRCFYTNLVFQGLDGSAFTPTTAT